MGKPLLPVGWLAEQFKLVEQEIARYPAWMFDVRPADREAGGGS